MGGFSFDNTDAGCCSGDTACTLNGDPFSSLFLNK
jgi:hypothetical protein